MLFVSACSDAAKQELAQVKARAEEASSRIARLESENKMAVERANAAEGQLEQKSKEVAQRVGEIEAELRARADRINAGEKALVEAQNRIVAIAGEASAMKERAAIAEAKISVYEADRTKTVRAAEEAARKATFTVQMGVTMRSGETKPVTNASVYLLKARLLDVAPGQFSQDDGRNSSNVVMVVMFPTLFRKSYATVMDCIDKNTVAKVSSDFSGRATFEGVEPGEYFVFCYTPLGKGAVFEKRVRVEGRSTMVSLDNEDIIL